MKDELIEAAEKLLGRPYPSEQCSEPNRTAAAQGAWWRDAFASSLHEAVGEANRNALAVEQLTVERDALRQQLDDADHDAHVEQAKLIGEAGQLRQRLAESEAGAAAMRKVCEWVKTLPSVSEAAMDAIQEELDSAAGRSLLDELAALRAAGERLREACAAVVIEDGFRGSAMMRKRVDEMRNLLAVYDALKEGVQPERKDGGQ